MYVFHPGRRGTCGGSRRDTIAERLPVRREPGRPRKPQVAHECQRVGRSAAAALSRTPHVLVDARVQIERRQAQIVRARQPIAHERVDHGKRLNRLRRVEVEAVTLVDEIEARSDDGYAPDTSLAECARGGQAVHRAFDPEAGENRGVGREPTLAKQRAASCRIGPGRVQDTGRFDRTIDARDVRRHVRQRLAKKPPRACAPVVACDVEAVANQQIARELQALVVAWRRGASDEVVDASVDQTVAARRARQLRDLTLGRARS